MLCKLKEIDCVGNVNVKIPTIRCITKKFSCFSAFTTELSISTHPQHFKRYDQISHFFALAFQKKKGVTADFGICNSTQNPEISDSISFAPIVENI